MKRASKGVAIVFTITLCAALAPAARAAHATNYLDAFHDEVTNRLAHAGTNGAAQKALHAASNVLGRDSRTFSADLTALAAAAKVLNTRFEDDATLLALEEEALAAYSTELHRQADGAKVRVEGFSNSLPRRVITQFRQGTNALARFDGDTNSLPSRARALAQAASKLRNPVLRILALYPNPPPQAPDELATSQNIQLEVPGPNPTTQTIYYFHTTSDGGATRSLTYFCNHPPENSEANPGSWQYIKTGKNTAILRCTPVSPPGLGVHDFTLTFTTTTIGTFTGSNASGQSIQGAFFID